MITCAVPLLAGLFVTLTAAAADKLSLEGDWGLELDCNNRGLQEEWFNRSLTGAVRLPGSLPAQGIGDEVTVETKWTGGVVDRSWFDNPEYAPYRQPGNVKVPFWLQPKKHYVGPAWYQKEIEIPEKWSGKRVVLRLERPHWETRVWVGALLCGTNNSLSTPHEFDLGTRLSPGKHRLTIRVDNSLVVDVGENSHSVSDHTQGNWNGIVGPIELRATSPVWLDDLQVYPEVATKSIRVKGRIGNVTGKAGRGQLVMMVTPLQLGSKSLTSSRVEAEWGPDSGTFETTLALGHRAELWDEFTPVIYRLMVWLEGGAANDARGVHFGLRQIATEGTQFTLNGRKTFFRGTLECAIFPKTGHPPVDVASWKRIINICKNHGLNMIRFHSWCPPEAAFTAADELGFYYQVEAASWANQSTTLGDGKPVDRWIYEETDRILRAYGSHPSFVLMAYGNEPGGGNYQPYLAQWVDHYKAQDARRLYTSGAGWPQISQNQFHVTPDPRVQAWGQGLKSRINALPPETETDYRDYIQKRSVPVISHEIGQWCVYPNFDEIPKYTGYLKAKNFEIFRESLQAKGLGDLGRKFLMASGKLQALCYKEDIESALRTPGMGGFQLLDLHDFPGQGTALVGVLDPFWDEKGYITPKEYRRFCNQTVPLVRLKQRVFTTADTLQATIEVAHFGPAPLERAVVAWKLVTEEGKAIARGKLPLQTVPVDNGVALGEISVPLQDAPSPTHCILVVGLEDTAFENDWDLWIYPAQVPSETGDVLVARELTSEALEVLNNGGRVLLHIPARQVKGDHLGRVELGFSSIFWNTAWTRRQPPHTLGILCDPGHPAFARFPTDYHSNWQWWYLIHNAGALNLDDLPRELVPTVQVIDDWVTNRKLGLVFEAQVDKGKLVVSGIDLENPQANLVSRQFRHSLLAYMNSPGFHPSVTLTPEQIRGLIQEPSRLEKSGARILKTSSAHASHPGENAIDGNPDTMWHTDWEDERPEFPHEIQVGFAQPIRLKGISLLPRQDGLRNGWIKGYELYVSKDGLAWGPPAATGDFSATREPHEIRFPAPQHVKAFRLVALSGHANGPWASIAELRIIE